MPHHTPRPWPALRRAGAGTVAVALLLGVAGLPALARASQEAPAPPKPIIKTTDPTLDPDPPPADEPPGPVPPLSPGLDKIAVTSPEFNAAERTLRNANDALEHIRQIERDAAQELISLAHQDAELTDHVERAQRRVDALSRRAHRLREELENLAVASYVSGTDLSSYRSFLQLDAAKHNQLRSQAVMVDTVNTDMTADLRRTTERLQSARHDLAVTIRSRDDVRARIGEVQKVSAQAGVQEQQASARVFAAIGQVEKWRRLAIVRGTDIPLVVLDSYVKATQISAFVEPVCGISWWALAGIGKTESHHASAGGAEPRADGSLTKPILGIPLDGSNATAAIEHGGVADRAQGPMQFITSTWLKWARDGNGDGVADVQNTYDAATAAAAYLCAGGPMRTDDDLRRGYFSYNHSPAYVEAVLARAHEYQQQVEIPPAD
jgi:membrane-bound lytic murein transglycosylase B